MMMKDLFSDDLLFNQVKLGEGTLFIRHFIDRYTTQFITEIQRITKQSPFRKMLTPNGYKMSVGMTSCGVVGWITNADGYCYSAQDPITHNPWPAMPLLFKELAVEAATQAGYPDFRPHSCLINRYYIGSKLSLHQDKDESNLNAPIVSFSLGLPASFQWGGSKRGDKVISFDLLHGDALIWGGIDRLRFHGILPIKPGCHGEMGEQRINFTFRQVY